MARTSKFSFLSGRRQPASQNNDNVRTSAVERKPAQTYETTKAGRLLGTEIPQPSRRGSATSSSLHPSEERQPSRLPSEAGSVYDPEHGLAPSIIEDLVIAPGWRSIQHRPSSNALGKVNYSEVGYAGSAASAASRQLHTQNSSSTLRSYYEPKKLPPSISQQTSASAVRDLGLRKGHVSIQERWNAMDEEQENAMRNERKDKKLHKRATKKEKPSRLDLSKLFPKPKQQGGNLLSPSHVVNSPVPISSTSEYFPSSRSMINRSTSTVNTQPVGSRSEINLSSSSRQRQSSAYDSLDAAKVNVRRPPKGIQHWFDALEEDSDEDAQRADQTLATADPHLVSDEPPTSRVETPAASRMTSLGRQVPAAVGVAAQSDQPQLQHTSDEVRAAHSGTLQPRRGQVRPETALSGTTQNTSNSGHNKISKLQGTNLQDESVLSFSSSESSDDEAVSRPIIRDSVEKLFDAGAKVIIGKAQAYELRPRTLAPTNSRNTLMSVSDRSLRSNQTDAETIEIALSPEVDIPQHALPPVRRGSRRVQYDEDELESNRPRTSHADAEAEEAPKSPKSTHSARSARTSRSEPRTRHEHHKLMAVTEEEEALLAMMRRKRAAMAKHSFAEGYKTALTLEQGVPSRRAQAPTPLQLKDEPRTSGFLGLASPTSPDLVSAFPAPSSNRASLVPRSNSQLSTDKRHSRQQQVSSSSSEIEPPVPKVPAGPYARESGRKSLRSDDYRLSSPRALSPMENLFPSRSATPASENVASPTTAGRTSPLPSPVTPSDNLDGRRGSFVKVAGSEPSCNGDEDSLLENSTSGEDKRRWAQKSPVVRGRTAALNALQKPAKPAFFDDEAVDPAQSYPQTVSRSIKSRSSQQTITSLKSALRDSTYSHGTATNIRNSQASSNAGSTGRSTGSSASKSKHAALGTVGRSSVSDDVLAAWGSLGGLRDWDGDRIAAPQS